MARKSLVLSNTVAMPSHLSGVQQLAERATATMQDRTRALRSAFMVPDEIDKNRTLFMTEYVFGREDEFVEVFTHVKDQCKKERRDSPFRKICVRDNHHHQVDLTIGGHLRAKLYRYTREKQQSDMLVSEERCIPIGGAFFDHHKHHYSFDAEIHFYDIREGIGNPVVWELPESCLQAQ